MSEIDARLPRDLGKGALPDHPAIKTPWEKLVSFYDAYHFILRNNAAFGAVFTEVMRILIPDYRDRNKRMCEVNYKVFYDLFKGQAGSYGLISENCFPFVHGAFISGLSSDSGDERLSMYGRVNDYGLNRIEKELDFCPFDIQGSEVCRISAYITEAIGDAYAEAWDDDISRKLEYNMYEAKGCGDMHCRFVIENREKYPLPPDAKKDKECWEIFGPIATADYIKCTSEDKLLSDPQQFREECDYIYRSGFDNIYTASEYYRSDTPGPEFLLGTNYVVPVLNDMLAKGETTEKKINHIIESVCGGAGKMMFADFYAKKGVRDWMGVPPEINDGRVLGAYIELILQMWKSDYSTIAFNKDEVIFDITRLGGYEHMSAFVVNGYIAMWYGMAKTLINAQWSAWRETDGIPEDTIRVKIAKKIDKFCR
jgi:hypothetical protein